MKEIEVKARVRDRAAFVQALATKNVTLSAPIHQEDRIYAESDITDFDVVHVGRNFLRIRRQGERVIFTLKSPITGHQDKLEHEVDVSDAAELAAIIQRLGFEERIRVVKDRQTSTVGDYQLCLDDIHDLGTFVEVERLADELADSLAIQEELFTFLETFGVSRADRELSAYDILLWQKQKHGA